MGDVLVDVLALAVISCLPLGLFLELRGRSGLPWNHRGKQTNSGPWKTILSSLPRLPWDTEAPLGTLLLPSILQGYSASIRLGSEREERTSFLRQLHGWDGMVNGQRRRRSQVTTKSALESNDSTRGLASSPQPFQRA